MTRRIQAVGAVLSVFVAALASCSGDDSGSAVGGTHAYDAGKLDGPKGDGTSTTDHTIITMDGPTTDTSGWDAFDPDSGCASTSVSAVQTPSNILFLIDKTGSMNCNPPPTTTTASCEQKPEKQDTTLPSKWEITRDALKGAMTGLTTTVPLPAAGIAYFNNGDACGYSDAPDVDIKALNATQATAISTSLDQIDPWGATPIVGALLRAYAYFQANSALFTGNKFVVILTDGGESCDPDAMPLAVQKALEAASIGIRTFVLGAPGSEANRRFLSQIAFNGGTSADPACDHTGATNDVGDCHMDMTQPNSDFATELAKNLAAISSQALSCEFEVPPPEDGQVVDPKKVNVNYTPGSGGSPVQFPRNDNLPCNDPANNGWQYSDNNTKIMLCGSACSAVKADGQAKISIVLGCETHTVPK